MGAFSSTFTYPVAGLLIARFGWELIPEGGHESVVVGFDVAVLAEDGRIKQVYGFLDKVPA